MEMSSADLDRIDSVLTPLVASDACSDDAKAAVQRFNAQIEQERSRLGAARARLGASGSLPVELAVALEAAVVMLAVERDRIVRRFRVPLRGSSA
jgi:hypothetical protein